MRPAILVPIKDPARAKGRLAPLLTAGERAELAWAMIEDLARTLAPMAGMVAAVTSSERVADRARAFGWRVLIEAEQRCESESVDAASSRLEGEGVEAVLRLPADLPLLETRDVRDMIDHEIPPASALMVPSKDLKGTNALLRRPPTLFPSRFGPDSFRLHLKEALAIGAGARVLCNPRIALDLDDQDDIEHFMRERSATETGRLIERLPIQERIRRRAGG